MLVIQTRLRAIAGLVTSNDEPNPRCSVFSSILSCPRRLSFPFPGLRRRDRVSLPSIVVRCNSSPGSFGGGKSNFNVNNAYGDDYVEASLLISETIRHHRMRVNGFQEDMRWHSSARSSSFPFQMKDPRADVTLLGQGFLRRFQNPTIFLKISCDVDFLLPIIVGQVAVENLIDSLQENESGGCPNQFQLVRNIVGELGYEVKMVRITERVINMYSAKIYFSKPGEADIFAVEARPSDAINVARRCRAPVFVNKQIVLMDAIRIAHGMGRMHGSKSIYDVTLDSAADGPDLLAEELRLVNNLNLALEEERYNDAVKLREKLVKLRESEHEI